MSNDIDIRRMQIVMSCFDKLPFELRQWIAELHFSLHDDHILRGEHEVRNCKIYVENNGKINYYKGNGQN
jgi:hypothetical protein